MARGVTRGEVWMYRFREPDKRRPVVVLTRSRVIPLLHSVMVAPVTSTIRGVASEVALHEDDGMNAPCVVNLHNIVTVSQAGIGRRLTKLSEEKMRLVREAISYSLGCEAP